MTFLWTHNQYQITPPTILAENPILRTPAYKGRNNRGALKGNEVVDKIQTKSVSTLRLKDVDKSRKAFIAGEPRYLFYLVATELIDLSRKRITKKVSVAQALAVLLQTWNVSFYRFRGGFHEEDLTKIEALLHGNLAASRSIVNVQ